MLNKKRKLMQQVRKVARQIKSLNGHLPYLWLMVRWRSGEQCAEMHVQYQLEDKTRYGLISNGKTGLLSLSYKMCEELGIDASYGCGILKPRRQKRCLI